MRGNGGEVSDGFWTSGNCYSALVLALWQFFVSTVQSGLFSCVCGILKQAIPF